MTNHEFMPDYAVIPGETIQEEIEYRGIAPHDLALHTNHALHYVNDVIEGYAAITPDFATALERTLGIPATFWNNLEFNYQKTLKRIGQTRPQKPSEVHATP